MSRKSERETRRLVFAKAWMRLGEEWPEIGIGNISSGGFVARTNAPPAVGEAIEVRHRGLTMQGRVVWVSGRRFGVEASEPIDLKALFAKSDLKAVSVEGGKAQAARKWLWHWRST